MQIYYSVCTYTINTQECNIILLLMYLIISTVVIIVSQTIDSDTHNKIHDFIA